MERDQNNWSIFEKASADKETYRDANFDDGASASHDDEASRFFRQDSFFIQSRFAFPQFPIAPENVTVLLSPTEFHQCLVDLYRSAKQRIVLAALYIGTASPEGEVVEAVAETCRRALLNPSKPSEDFESLDRPASTRSSSSELTTTASTGAAASSVAMEESSRFSVDILIDSARGRRLEQGGSSLTMLESLFDLQEIANQKTPTVSCTHPASSLSESPSSTASPVSINVNLFHSPLLSGLLYRVLPPRVNEILGVFHTKIFLADNTVVLTGANLSGSYLTNRQDRYVVIKDAPLLADFLHRFIRLVQKFSFFAEIIPTVQQAEQNLQIPSEEWWNKQRSNDRQVPLSNGKTVALRLNQGIPDPTNSAEEFKRQFGQALNNFLVHQSPPNPQTSLSSTSLLVAIQAGFCNPAIQQEQELLSLLLPSLSNSSSQWHRRLGDYVPWSSPSFYSCPSRRSAAESPFLPNRSSNLLGDPIDRIVLASGYLNMADELLERLANSTASSSSDDTTNDKPATLEVFMAAPEANSFFQSQGLSKYIPMAYSYVAATQLLRLRQLWEQRRREDALAVRYNWEPSGTFSRWLLGFGSVEQRTQAAPLFWEYDRAAWTFHSKGIWFYPRQQDGGNRREYPTATIVGSSNFGLRSCVRDLDVSFLIQTKDRSLQQQFQKEIDVMRQHSREVADVSLLASRCPRWLRFLLRWAGLKTLL
ncbi:probable CDP-diacylglycerol--glycerol-3-phosphate 3-phosphatidyltransferase [Condylostylus longicornis]|uniref:probable CDP-diacylglycerol--glycerol-3-phosphate 3-phosphatidyltransferase n=1 Tax=Condylostylus longicornis TaxID=2530218 RepID=UPI00244E49F9|nr:probable CDP-diacylglycerol--glycerol-3-phosphate 3-phosphatidyltransferase [Condylostylus longicornis]